jgi:hypothetical protein
LKETKKKKTKQTTQNKQISEKNCVRSSSPFLSATITNAEKIEQSQTLLHNLCTSKESRNSSSQSPPQYL